MGLHFLERGSPSIATASAMTAICKPDERLGVHPPAHASQVLATLASPLDASLHPPAAHHTSRLPYLTMDLPLAALLGRLRRGLVETAQSPHVL